jgi:hypothetical protein
MFKKVTHTLPHYWTARIGKWFGVKIEPTRDGANRAGLYLLFWYPRSATRLGYASAWLPHPFKR